MKFIEDNIDSFNRDSLEKKYLSPSFQLLSSSQVNLYKTYMKQSNLLQ